MVAIIEAPELFQLGMAKSSRSPSLDLRSCALQRGRKVQKAPSNSVGVVVGLELVPMLRLKGKVMEKLRQQGLISGVGGKSV